MSIFKRKDSKSKKEPKTAKVKNPEKDPPMVAKIRKEEDDILDQAAIDAIDKRMEAHRKMLEQDQSPNKATQSPAKKKVKAKKTNGIMGLGGLKFTESDLTGISEDLTADLSPTQSNIDVTSQREQSDTDKLTSKRVKTSTPHSTPGRTSPASQPALKRQRVEPLPELTRSLRDTIPAADIPEMPRADLGELRLDIAKISSDIENGEALYRRAQSRVESLVSFVEKAEINFSLINRLEPENRRLKARNLTLSRDNENATHRISVLESDLNEHKKRLLETTADLKAVNGQFAQTIAQVETLEGDIKDLKTEKDTLAMRAERERTSFEVEARENEKLREKITDLSAVVEDTSTEKMNFAKVIESLKIDCEDQRVARESSEKESGDLRHALEEARKQNNEMKSQVLAVHEEIKNFKTQYEFNILSRDDRIFALEAQIDDLTKQLKIKDDIVTSASLDVAGLRKTRTAHELERERLEKVIENQSYQLHMAEEQLLKSKQNMQELDKRYRDAAAALSVVHDRRQDQAPATTPDIQPLADDYKLEQRRTTNVGDVSASEIEDRILDYKLGLRNDIA